MQVFPKEWTWATCKQQTKLLDRVEISVQQLPTLLLVLLRTLMTTAYVTWYAHCAQATSYVTVTFVEAGDGTEDTEKYGTHAAMWPAVFVTWHWQQYGCMQLCKHPILLGQ